MVKMVVMVRMVRVVVVVVLRGRGGETGKIMVYPSNLSVISQTLLGQLNTWMSNIRSRKHLQEHP